MQGIRFINEICKEFNLNIIDSSDRYLHIFNTRDFQNPVSYYNLNDLYILWISKRKIALLIRNTGHIKYFPISEKHKILQLISEALSK